MITVAWCPKGDGVVRWIHAPTVRDALADLARVQPSLPMEDYERGKDDAIDRLRYALHVGSGIELATVNAMNDDQLLLAMAQSGQWNIYTIKKGRTNIWSRTA